MRLISLLAASALAAPVAAQVPAAPDPEQVRGAAIYWMPKTQVTLEAVARLRDCSNGASDVAVTLIANAAPDVSKPIIFDPTSLSSWRQSRSFSLTLHPNGTLAGINAASEDKTGVIIGNIFKAIWSIVGVLGVADAYGRIGICNEGTSRSLARADVLRRQLAALRPAKWAGSGTGAVVPNAEADAKRAEVVASELAALEAGPLTITTRATLDLARPAGAPIQWETTPDWSQGAFDKWFGTPHVPASLSAMRVRIDMATADTCAVPAKGCRKFMRVPQPALATFAVLPASGATSTTPTAAITVQQWGKVGTLCLDAPLFASRTVAVSYDGFGQLTKFDWTSNARGEAASGVLAELAGQAATAYASLKPAEDPTLLEATKSQADLIDQQIRLARLRRCLSQMEAGLGCEE